MNYRHKNICPTDNSLYPPEKNVKYLFEKNVFYFVYYSVCCHRSIVLLQAFLPSAAVTSARIKVSQG